MSLAEVAEANSLSWTTLSHRLTRSGRSLADALCLPNWTQLRTAVEIDGVRRSMAAWARHYGVPYGLFRDRIKRGVDPKDAAQQPRGVRVAKLVRHDGERLPIKEWAKRTGVSYCTLSARLRAGWSVERALASSEPIPRAQPSLFPEFL